jgi:hypothetical protein
VLPVPKPSVLRPKPIGSSRKPRRPLELLQPRTDGGLLAETRTLLIVAVPSPPPERALALHGKGIEQLEGGNVFAARRLLEQAAEAGLAQSAVALAATYDPDELAKLNVVGLVPDVEAARKWYEKARELGAIEATERLRRLRAR